MTSTATVDRVDSGTTLSRSALSRRLRSLLGRALLVFGCASLLAAAPLFGQEQAGQVSTKELVALGFFQDFDELDLEELLVADEVKSSLTTRRELALTEAPGVLTVVDADQIRNLGARTLREVLRTLPGFDIQTNNLDRSQIIVRGIRGYSGTSENVLVLLDGQRLNEALTGGATLINLEFPVENIKRVEVLRGPGSTLYGGGALAAVINIVTFTPEDLEGIEVVAGGGSFQTTQLTLRLGAEIKGVGIGGFVHFKNTNGARLSVPEDAQTVIDRANPEAEPLSFAPGPTTDDGRTLESLYRLTYKDLSFEWRLKQETSGGYIGVTDSLSQQTDLNNRQMLLAGAYERPVGEMGSLLARVAWTRNEIRELLETYPPNYEIEVEEGTTRLPSGGLLQTALNSDRLDAELELGRDFSAGHRLVAGLRVSREATRNLQANGNMDYRTNELLSEEDLVPLPGAVKEASRNVFAAYVDGTWRRFSPDLAITAGARVDHLSDLETIVSPRFAAVWALPRTLTLKALYGRSFRAPSFRELYFEPPGLFGNPELELTTADTVEAQLAFDNQAVQVSAAYFMAFVRKPIVPEDTYSIGQPQLMVNGAGLDTQGIEIEARARFANQIAFASFTYQHPENVETGERAPNVPSVLGSLGATFLIRERYSLTPSVTFRSSLPRVPGDARPDLEGHALVNFSFSGRQVMRKLDLGATIYNLFDKEYFDPSPSLGVPGDYPQPGRSVFVYATYRF